MKEIKLYQCDVCGTKYAEKLKAKECEKYHAKELVISDCKYHGMNVCGRLKSGLRRKTEKKGCIDYDKTAKLRIADV